jgi:RNA polymerase sigma-70 factor (sigma-E family)
VIDEEFTSYVDAAHQRLLRRAIFLTGDMDLAEDLVQATLIRLYSSWTRVRRDVDAYARRVMVHLAVSWSRRRSRHELPTVQLPENADIDPYQDVDDHYEVISALRLLPARQRAAIALRYLDDLSVEDTAELLGCSVGTVKSQTSRGLNTLRRLLGGVSVAEEGS